ncbi:COG4223 family protein [Rhizobium sp. G21]|uniref:COG4223 family protein n=1 Tax=Rhizobium sp. G21 TaxID=2758439 RepID=UPI0015FF7862|nr:COG4223 family protein [Rhizobium sp. G21]MBB1249562.1 COG4223 family protein [Rhizobium sp. G21]
METEKPRHSRTTVDPRTIDLTADAVKAETEAEALDVSEEPVVASETAEKAADPAIPTREPADRESATTAGASPAATSGASGISLIAASLIGGVVALAGAAGLQYWGVLPSLGGNEKVEQSINLVSSDVEALKSSVSALASAKPEVDLTPVNDKIAAIETRLQDVPKANGLSVDADQRLSALNQQVSDLKMSLDDARKAEETARAELVMRIEALEKKAAEPGDDVAVAVAIASASLKAAIDRGGPFSTELDTLASVAPDMPALEALRPFADTGAPARAKLVASFPATADLVMEALKPEDPNQSITDRLLESAFSAIKVRPVGDVQGDQPADMLARIEDRLTNGDLKAAAAEWDKLPEEGRKAGASFRQALDARIKVEDLVAQTLTNAVRNTDSKG